MSDPKPRYRLFFGQKMTPRQIMAFCSSGLLVVAAIAGGSFAAVRFGSSSNETAQGESAETSGADRDEPRRLSVPMIQLKELAPRQIEQRFSGIVAAKRSSRLGAKNLGLLVEVPFHLGDQVEAGELVARFDDAELKAEREALAARIRAEEARLAELKTGPRAQEIEQAEALVDELRASLALRESILARANTLVQSGSVSEQEYDEDVTSVAMTKAQLAKAISQLALLREGTRREQIDVQEAQVASLKAELSRVDVRLADCRVVAPFSGHVQARFVDEGVILSPGQPIVELVETSQLEIRVGIPSSFADAEVLKTARLVCGYRKVPLSVVRKGPAIDSRSRNVEVVFGVGEQALDDLQIPRDNGELRLGEAVEVSFSSKVAEGGWWVPTTALTPGVRGLWSVYIGEAREGNFYQVKLVPVELVRSSGDWSQIQGPISGENWVVIDGLHRITPNQIVRGMMADEILARRDR